MRIMTDRIQQILLRNSHRDDFVLSKEAQQFLNKGGIIVRMRGLPYECSSKQVIDFFRDGEQSCEVFDGENGILFVKKPDGRSTGDAFVQFLQESEVLAALSKHKELIGTRYIELFRSTPAEVEQVLRKSQETKPRVPVQLPLVGPIPSTVPQHVITSGTKKDCIRLRGLPYEAQVEHILDFLGDNANNIVLQGVHMVYNVHGQPSGEAFIQMDSESSASQAANHCHHRYMNFGKKQRYVEVFQCSGDDMNAFLNSGHVSPKATSVMNPGIDNNIPGMGLAFPSTLLPYYEPSPVSLMPLVQTNPFLLNPLALQQQQSALAASFLNKPPPKAVYSLSPSAYPWTTDVDAFKTTTASVTTTTDSLVKPKPAEVESLPSQTDLYPSYPSQSGVYFFHQNIPRVVSNPVFPKPGFPSIPAPVIFPQVTPQLTPMGMLGVKRSWEQAFPLETATVQEAKRWPTPQIASFATPGFYHDVGIFKACVGANWKNRVFNLCLWDFELPAKTESETAGDKCVTAGSRPCFGFPFPVYALYYPPQPMYDSNFYPTLVTTTVNPQKWCMAYPNS